MSRKEHRAEMRRKHGPDWWKANPGPDTAAEYAAGFRDGANDWDASMEPGSRDPFTRAQLKREGRSAPYIRGYLQAVDRESRSLYSFAESEAEFKRQWDRDVLGWTNPSKRRTNRRRYFTSERQELIHLLYDHGYGRDIEGAQRVYERLRRKGLSASGIREWVDQEYREGRVRRFGSTPRYNRRRKNAKDDWPPERARQALRHAIESTLQGRGKRELDVHDIADRVLEYPEVEDYYDIDDVLLALTHYGISANPRR